MKRCVGGCGGTYMIRDGNLCRGCENRKKSQGQSIESMFERLSVSSSRRFRVRSCDGLENTQTQFEEG